MEIVYAPKAAHPQVNLPGTEKEPPEKHDVWRQKQIKAWLDAMPEEDLQSLPFSYRVEYTLLTQYIVAAIDLKADYFGNIEGYKGTNPIRERVNEKGEKYTENVLEMKKNLLEERLKKRLNNLALAYTKLRILGGNPTDDKDSEDKGKSFTFSTPQRLNRPPFDPKFSTPPSGNKKDIKTIKEGESIPLDDKFSPPPLKNPKVVAYLNKLKTLKSDDVHLFDLRATPEEIKAAAGNELNAFDKKVKDEVEKAKARFGDVKKAEEEAFAKWVPQARDALLKRFRKANPGASANDEKTFLDVADKIFAGPEKSTTLTKEEIQIFKSAKSDSSIPVPKKTRTKVPFLSVVLPQNISQGESASKRK